MVYIPKGYKVRTFAAKNHCTMVVCEPVDDVAYGVAINAAEELANLMQTTQGAEYEVQKYPHLGAAGVILKDPPH